MSPVGGQVGFPLAGVQIPVLRYKQIQEAAKFQRP